MGWRKENLPKKERKSSNKKTKTEQIQQEQQHLYKGGIIFLGCSVAHEGAA
jgi:hypothetical protein